MAKRTPSSSRPNYLPVILLLAAAIVLILVQSTYFPSVGKATQSIPPSSQISPTLFQPSGPVIGYHKSTAGPIDTAYGIRCKDSACAGFSIFSPGNGLFVAATLPSDNLPFLAYSDHPVTTYLLKGSKCTDAACSAFTTTILDSSTVTPHKSITHFSDGRPVIAYQRSQPRELYLLLCSNASCSDTSPSGNQTIFLDSGGYYKSVAIGSDGSPIVAYSDESTHTLKVAKCSNPACTSVSTQTIELGSAGGSPSYPSIAIAQNGKPIISYTNYEGQLKLAYCNDLSCTYPSSVVSIPGVKISTQSSLTVPADGKPIISFYDRSQHLSVLKCKEPLCTAPPTVTVLDGAGDAGFMNAITLASDGLPFIAYKSGIFELKSVKCLNPSCTSANPLTIHDTFISNKIVTTDN